MKLKLKMLLVVATAGASMQPCPVKREKKSTGDISTTLNYKLEDKVGRNVVNILLREVNSASGPGLNAGLVSIIVSSQSSFSVSLYHLA